MTRRLTAEELKANEQKRLRTAARKEREKLARMAKARREIDLRWTSYVLWAPVSEKQNAEMLRPEWK